MAWKRLLPLIQKEIAIETTVTPRQFRILLFPVREEDLLHYMERVGENHFPKKGITILKKWIICLASAMENIHGRRVEDLHDFRSEPGPDELERMTLCYYATAYKLRNWFATKKGKEDKNIYSLMPCVVSSDRNDDLPQDLSRMAVCQTPICPRRANAFRMSGSLMGRKYGSWI